MSENLPPCPECASEYTYQDGALIVCPMCGHEFEETTATTATTETAEATETAPRFLDAVGNQLVDGDTVTVTENLNVKGGASIKRGTKVTGIKLLDEPVNGHDIAAKIPGAGQMYLKCSVVKKA